MSARNIGDCNCGAKNTEMYLNPISGKFQCYDCIKRELKEAQIG